MPSTPCKDFSAQVVFDGAHISVNRDGLRVTVGTESVSAPLEDVIPKIEFILRAARLAHGEEVVADAER